MLVAIRGGEQAIENAERLLIEQRRGDPAISELSVEQIGEQLSLAVDRTMNEGALYDRHAASLALKQAQGDAAEAAFLLRTFRATLPRAGYSEPLHTASMQIERRITPIVKEAPGGQYLGATYDYIHRLLDEKPTGPDKSPISTDNESDPIIAPHLADRLARDGIAEKLPSANSGADIFDITRDPVMYPANREVRLQSLSRADEGFLTGLANSTLQGYGENFPLVTELRVGDVAVDFTIPELGFAVTIGRVTLSECEILNKKLDVQSDEPRFTRGYGLSLGRSERRAMAMAVNDRALKGRDLGEAVQCPIEDEQFVLSNADGVEAAGLLQSLKLPHYVSFQAELKRLRDIQAKHLLRGENSQ
ncbi:MULTISPECIES: carbon-phosphorus lyase complex subunit PhnI [unclassified Sinorhizobium]|uniref:carbon-phosphorus lyase complex subunit PhnI n=1 Tax=unclassified Sinorhizobium TaxID=2613772 RepID=UPI0024C39575|nr:MULTISPECIES: carbon-phosphorus lyase complex subunit PhnI [unclassified Sinorhizobium]MDK1378143.1 carbon-phosphorus lyase complex subunit PhnI [Sinorhizobium sp. 6-70]MDK1483044.1 carbon-phosphorus lyase complex subunit PhnI [Sinorhizobium sp. 6-117]